MATVTEFHDADQTLRDISRLYNRINIKIGYKSLQAYRQGIPTDEVNVPQPDDPLDSEAVDKHYDQLRSELDDAVPELEAEKAERREQAIAMLEELLNDLPVDGDTKKSKIIALKEALRSDIGSRLLADVVDCKPGYPGRFQWDDSQGCVELRDDVKARKKQRFSESQKQQIKERDGHACVNCGTESSIRIHHIIPVDAGGKGNIDNGATLCDPCHNGLHQWDTGYDDDYESVSEFWNWAED